MADTGTVLEVIVSTGILTAIGETIRWWLGRGSSRVDNAKAVQGMALDLLKPLHDELERTTAKVAAANVQVEACQTKVIEIERELDAVVLWALLAKSLLDEHAVSYPPVPAPVRARLKA